MPDILKLVFFILLFTLLTVLVFYLLQPKNLLFNGPAPFPLVGNIKTLKRLQDDPDGELGRLKSEWGPIYTLWFGTSPVLIVNSPQVAKELLNEVGLQTSRSEAQAYSIIIREAIYILLDLSKMNSEGSYGHGD